MILLTPKRGVARVELHVLSATFQILHVEGPLQKLSLLTFT